MPRLSHLSPPQHKTPPPPRRLFALGGAALVTVMTLAGALGFGPGAAMGDTQPRERLQGAASGDSGDTSSSSDPTSDGWLIVEPTTPPPSDSDTDSVETALPAKTGHGVRIVFDISDQRVWLVGSGNTISRTYLVSGSKEDNLDPGTYSVYSKSSHAVSFDHRETMNYMVRFAHGDSAPIGFHDIPRFPDGTLAETRSDLGTPLSAGCIRQWAPDAKALWRFADVGTTVVVTA